jgi:hypothetical protein
MKSILVIVMAWAFCFTLPSCKKTSTGGSPYTHLLCGSHNFVATSYGYVPPVGGYVADSSDITEAITCNSASSVSFSGTTFTYDSTAGDSLLHFYFASNYALNGGYLNFNRLTNTIYIYESIHVSAGGGQWTYTYTSY